MSKIQNTLGYFIDDLFVYMDDCWDYVSESFPDLSKPIPVLKLGFVGIIFSLVSSFLPFNLALFIAVCFFAFFITTFFDLKPKLWSGASSQQEYRHAWSTRGFLLWLMFSTVLSSWLGNEYSHNIFVCFFVCIIYPFVATLALIAFAAQVALQSHSLYDHRYQPVSRHED